MRKPQEQLIENLLAGRNLSDLQLQSPHEKPFMPGKVGRLVDRVSYRDWMLLTGVVFAGAVTSLVCAPEHNGLQTSSGNSISEFLPVLYFCVVTFTTLGYGDLVPVGVGRLVASVLTVYGVMSLAFLIGKVASERSQATLFLLHTSDRERRVKAFADELKLARDQVLAAADTAELRRTTRQLDSLMEAISNYIVFHVHHLKMGHLGNAPTLARLISELAKTVSASTAIVRSEIADAVAVKRSWNLASRIEGLIGFLTAAGLQTEEDVTATVVRVVGRRQRTFVELGPGQRTMLVRLLQDLRGFRELYSARPHAAWLEDVLLQCDGKPLSRLPKHFHKSIANNLSISRKLAQRCLDRLVSDGRLKV